MIVFLVVVLDEGVDNSDEFLKRLVRKNYLEATVVHICFFSSK